MSDSLYDDTAVTVRNGVGGGVRPVHIVGGSGIQGGNCKRGTSEHIRAVVGSSSLSLPLSLDHLQKVLQAT